MNTNNSMAFYGGTATALAFAATIALPPARLEGDNSRPFSVVQSALQTPTVEKFALAISGSEGDRVPSASNKEFGLIYVDDSFARLPSGQMIVGFRQTPFAHLSLVDFDLRNTATEKIAFIGSAVDKELLIDIVEAGLLANAQPVIEELDIGVTIDFASGTSLVSVLIDSQTCYVSAISSYKELRMSYDLTKCAGTSELVDFVWQQVRLTTRNIVET